MKYTLSESTIRLIQGENITQQELVRKIDELYESKKVNRTFSQQSISRYLNGKAFPASETEDIILLAVRGILGVRNFRMLKRKYKMMLEEEQKRREPANKRKQKKTEEIAYKGIGIRRLANSEKTKDLFMSDEEIGLSEERQERAEIRQVVEVWRNTSEKIQEFWLQIGEILCASSAYIKEVFLLLVGASQEEILNVANEFYFEYCADNIKNIYTKYADDFSNEELKVMGEIIYASGRADEKLYKLIQEGSDLHHILSEGNCEWKMCDNDERYKITNEKEQTFIELYERSKLFYEDFLMYMALFVCFEKADWLVIHMALLLEKSQRENLLRNVYDGRMMLTEAEIKFLDYLRACK